MCWGGDPPVLETNFSAGRLVRGPPSLQPLDPPGGIRQPFVLKQPSWKLTRFNIASWQVANLSIAREIAISENETAAAPAAFSVGLPTSSIRSHKEPVLFLMFINWDSCRLGSLCGKTLNTMNRFLQTTNRGEFVGGRASQLILVPIHESMESFRNFLVDIPPDIVGANDLISVMNHDAARLLVATEMKTNIHDEMLANELFVLQWKGKSEYPGVVAGVEDVRKFCWSARDRLGAIKQCEGEDEGDYQACVLGKLSYFKLRCNFLYMEFRDVLLQLRLKEEYAALRGVAAAGGGGPAVGITPRSDGGESSSSSNSTPSSSPSAGLSSLGDGLARLGPSFPPPETRRVVSFATSISPPLSICSSCVQFLEYFKAFIDNVTCSAYHETAVDIRDVRKLFQLFVRFPEAQRLFELITHTNKHESQFPPLHRRSERYCEFLTRFLVTLLQHAKTGVLQSDQMLRQRNPSPIFHIIVSHHSTRKFFIRDLLPPSSAILERFIYNRFESLRNSRSIKLFVVGDEEGIGKGQLYYDNFDDIANSLAENFCDKTRLICTIRLIVLEGQEHPYSFNSITDTPKALADIEALSLRLKAGRSVDYSFLQSAYPGILVMKSTEIEEYQRAVLKHVPVVRLHRETLDQMRATAHGGAVVRGRSRDIMLTTTSGGGSRGGDVSYHEQFLKQLINWFSEEYFAWVPNPIMCDIEDCGGARRFGDQGVVDDPDAEDSLPSFQKRVLCENHYCKKCGDEMSYIRPLTNVMQIITSRMGRCGEFAKAFALVARALGYPVRLVMGEFIDPKADGFGYISSFHLKKKKTKGGGGGSDEGDDGESDSDSATADDQQPLDHMWNEVYLEPRKSWVHVDVSVGPYSNMGLLDASKRFDSPEIYDTPERRIKLVSAIAAEPNRIAVVTPRYLNGYTGLQRAESHMSSARLKNGAKRLTALMRGVELGGSTGGLEAAGVEAGGGSIDGELSSLSRLIGGDIVYEDEKTNEEDEFVKKFPLDPLVGKSLQRNHKLTMGNLTFAGTSVIPKWMSMSEDQRFSSYYTLMSLEPVVDWWVSKIRVCKNRVSKEREPIVKAVDEVSFEYSSSSSVVDGGTDDALVIRTFSTKPVHDIEWMWKGELDESDRECVEYSIDPDSFIQELSYETRTIQKTNVVVDVSVVISSRRAVMPDADVPTSVPISYPHKCTVSKPNMRIVGIYGNRELIRSDPFGFIGCYAIEVEDRS